MKKNGSIISKLLFVILGLAFIILPMSATNLNPSHISSPDLLFCLIFSFLIHNQNNAPIIVIVLLSLLADFLWYRPIGLTPFLILITSELLRRRLVIKGKISVFEELLLVTLTLFTVSAFQEILKFFVLIPSIEIIQVLHYILFTLAVYPIFTLILRTANKLSFKNLL